MNRGDAIEAPASPATRTLLAFSGILAVYFIANLDIAIVATSLPVIAGSLGGIELFGWVGAAYLLALSATAPVYAKLGDMFGRRTIVFAAVGIFLVGSLACGLAWSMESLVAFRTLQGIGGGGLTVSAYAMIGDLFEGRERARYQSYVAIVFTLAVVSGPLFGGIITDYLGWRWIFLVNLPVGLTALAILGVALPGRFAPRQHRIDYAGGLLLATGVSLLIFWCDYVLGPDGSLLLAVALPVAGVASLIAFVAVERRATEPIIPLRLFADRTITLIVVATFTAGSVSLGILFHHAFYLQMIGSLTSTALGFLMLITPVGSLVTATISGRLVARTGRYKIFLVLGMALGAANMLALSQTGPATPVWALGLINLSLGFALGLWMQTIIMAVQNAAPKADMGVGTGLATLSRALGGSLGLALNGAIAALGLGLVVLPPDFAGLVPGGLTALTPQAVAALPPTAAAAVLADFAAGFHALYYYAAAIYAVALGVMLLLPDSVIGKKA